MAVALAVAVALAIAIAVVPAEGAWAAPGDPDPSFAGDGIVRTDLTSDRSVSDTAMGVALQTDGKIVVAGRAGGAGGRFAVLRLDVDGALDGSFGGDGKVFTNLGPVADVALDVAMQADGKIVAVGSAGGSGGGIALVRYNPHGPLDSTFGGDGTVVTPFLTPNAAATGIAIQDDGKIVVTAKAGSGFVVARYQPNGTLDPSFKGDGIVRTDFTLRDDVAADLALRTDGTIVVAGTARVGASDGDSMFAVARYLEDGRLDDSFGDDGRVIGQISSAGDIAHDIAVGSSGQVLVVGTTGLGAIDPDTRSVAIQFDAAGAVDPSFSDDGIRTMNVTNRPDVAASVAIDADGKVVVGGVSIGSGPCCPSKAWILRYAEDGRVDNTFQGGEMITEPGVIVSAHDLAVQADRSVVIVGRTGAGAARFVTLRFLGA